MSLEDDLKVERYKLVTERQKYFTDLAKDTFTSYSKMFAAFSAGAVALVSLKKQLGIEPSVVNALLQAIAVLLTLAAVLSIGQILFCLRRWYGFRHAECEINSDAPRPENWAWLFEGMYCVGMGVSVIFAWWGVHHFEAILAQI
ncbi:MAG: hypothetical protein KIT42_12110 [Rhodocyclaceae bacterium]|nr:hypothetical protein [Rhodocyclaceae bacterium]